jgi:hypothetical protein
MAPFSQARQILAHARELTLRKRGTQRPPVTLLSLVDGEFPKAPSPLAPRSEAPPPRGASTFWKTHNSATRTRLRPFYLWTGDDPIRIEPRFPPPRSSAYPRRRYRRRRLTPLGGDSLEGAPIASNAPMLPARVCAAHRKAPHGSGCAVPEDRGPYRDSQWLGRKSPLRERTSAGSWTTCTSDSGRRGHLRKLVIRACISCVLEEHRSGHPV